MMTDYRCRDCHGDGWVDLGCLNDPSSRRCLKCSGGIYVSRAQAGLATGAAYVFQDYVTTRAGDPDILDFRLLRPGGEPIRGAMHMGELVDGIVHVGHTIDPNSPWFGYAKSGPWIDTLEWSLADICGMKRTVQGG